MKGGYQKRLILLWTVQKLLEVFIEFTLIWDPKLEPECQQNKNVIIQLG